MSMSCSCSGLRSPGWSEKPASCHSPSNSHSSCLVSPSEKGFSGKQRAYVYLPKTCIDLHGAQPVRVAVLEVLVYEDNVPNEVTEASIPTFLGGVKGKRRGPPHRRRREKRRPISYEPCQRAFSSQVGFQLLPDTADLLQACIFLAISSMQGIVSRSLAGQARGRRKPLSFCFDVLQPDP